MFGYLAFWDAELRKYRLYTHIRILQRSNLDRRNWARYLRQQKTKDWSFTNFKLFLACFKNFRTRKNIRSSRQPSQKATSCISRLHKRLSPFHKLSGFKYDISLVVERIHDLSDGAKQQSLNCHDYLPRNFKFPQKPSKHKIWSTFPAYIGFVWLLEIFPSRWWSLLRCLCVIF